MSDPLVHREETSPNFDERALPISMVVLHYTEMKPVENAIDKMCNPKAKVSAHYCITEAGEVIRLVPEEK
ncbi:MAG: N-acetylmuramoyl-L-alanine amidase, partial [Alteraurantiacibacter sp.]